MFLLQVSRRSQLDGSVQAAVQQLLARPDTLTLLRSKYGQQLGPELSLGAGAGAAGAGFADVAGLAELLVGGELPRPAEAALVDDWDCLRVSGKQ